MDISDEFS